MKKIITWQQEKDLLQPTSRMRRVTQLMKKQLSSSMKTLRNRLGNVLSTVKSRLAEGSQSYHTQERRPLSWADKLAAIGTVFIMFIVSLAIIPTLLKGHNDAYYIVELTFISIVSFVTGLFFIRRLGVLYSVLRFTAFFCGAWFEVAASFQIASLLDKEMAVNSFNHMHPWTIIVICLAAGMYLTTKQEFKLRKS